MSQYHDNQLAAAMMLRGYGLSPSMPGFGYQVRAMGDRGGGGYDPVDVSGRGSTPDYNPPSDTVDSTPPPAAPSDNPGLIGGLNDNFAHSPLGRIISLFRPNGPQPIPRPDLNVRLVPLDANDWQQNAQRSNAAGGGGGSGSGFTWGTGPTLSQPTSRSPQLNSVVYGYQPTHEAQQWGLGMGAEGAAQQAFLRTHHRI